MSNKIEIYEDGQLIEAVPYTDDELKEIANNNILAQIVALEATQTPRRMRDAINDPTWLQNLEAQIAILRSQLE